MRRAGTDNKSKPVFGSKDINVTSYLQYRRLAARKHHHKTHRSGLNIVLIMLFMLCFVLILHSSGMVRQESGSSNGANTPLHLNP